MRPELLALALLAAAVGGPRLAAEDPAPAPAPDPATTRELYSKNCATCHGETGDGKGTQVLEKPARSFKDGGFSYGNTPEALLRTITHGIPGTPMPGFTSALTEEQRKALAAYVITLGPEVVEVKASETRLVVRDAPLFARGKLPPIVEGAPETVRGLLVGTTDGFTFEYRVDDVRLLGVRQGDFVERRDWNGRGGDMLLPLGKLVYASGPRTDAGSVFVWVGELGDRASIRAVFEGTQVREGRPHVFYRLLTKDIRELGSLNSLVDETVSARSSSIGSGFVRSLVLDHLDAEERGPGWLAWIVAQATGTKEVAAGDAWCVRSRPDGTFELQAVKGLGAGDHFGCDGERVVLTLRADVVARRTVEVVSLLLPSWNEAVRATWDEERAR